MTVQTTNRADLLNRSRRGNRAVKNTTAHEVDTASAASGVRELAEQLPDLDAVREVAEGDTSPLSEEELQQRAATERVIHSAMAAGDAAIWVIGQALTVAAKGKFHRDKGLTFDQYAREETGKSPAHVRRWMDGAPLALAVTAALGQVTPPEGHMRPLRKVEKALGRAPTIELYRAADETAGEKGRKVTGAVIEQIHRELPSKLPDDPAEAADIVRDTARRVASNPAPSNPSPIGEKAGKAGKPAKAKAAGAGKGGPGSVHLSAEVPAAVAARFSEWGTELSARHRVKVSAADVLALVAELAAEGGSDSLDLMSGRIEQRHGEQLGEGITRFAWPPSSRSKALRIAERRLAGHPAVGEPGTPVTGEESVPECGGRDGEAESCADVAVWRVDDPKQGSAYYCAGHLPEEDTPPGVRRQ